MPHMDFQVKTERMGQSLGIVHVQGEVDLYRAPEIEEAVTTLILTGWKQIIVDVERVTFIDTSGVGVLIGALGRLKKRGGCLAVAAMDKRFAKLLEIMHLSLSFQTYETLPDALRAMQENVKLSA